MGWKREVSRKLAELTDRTVRNYSTCEFGSEENSDCISVVIERAGLFDPRDTLDHMEALSHAQTEAEMIVFRIRKALPAGVVCFVGTTRFPGDGPVDGAEIVVGPGDSQFDILRHARSDALNYDMQTADLIAKLQTYDDEFGIDIYHAETDIVEFMLLGLPEDVLGFAQSLYRFCPDMVDRGLGTVEELEEDIRETLRVRLWWD